MTKLATYQAEGGRPRIGIVHDGDGRVFDLAAAAERAGAAAGFASMLDLMDAGAPGLETARRLFDDQGREEDLSVALTSVTLLAPVPRPRQMRDGMNFPTHIRQGPRGARKLAARGDAEAIARIDAEPLEPLADVYRQMPIYYITNRMIVRGPGATVRWPRYSEVMDYELEFGVFLGRTGPTSRLRRRASTSSGSRSSTTSRRVTSR